ncbi:hypothetical protein [Actinomadura kijaniata]|uniref:hypothetical protein n=1 Tax=Actinomadura kijaniata TaxID=46161 RepID=UPI0008342624|nr:hypothetical protein [Actinomadura kijaniata]
MPRVPRADGSRDPRSSTGRGTIDRGDRAEEVPLNAAPTGHRAELHELAAILADVARRLASADRAIDRALRERTRAVGLIRPRVRAAARARARLRAVDRALDRVPDLVPAGSGDPPFDAALLSFRVDVLARALCSVPSYELPADRSEIRGWIRLLGRALGLDIGLVPRFGPDGVRGLQGDLAEAVQHARARVEALLNARDEPGHEDGENGTAGRRPRGESR